MKTSPIHEIHRSLGARFTELKGWNVVANYGDPVAEHLSVRKGVGIADLSHRGKVQITGKERAPFLQRVLSQDISRLKPSTGAYSALLDVRGHMLSYMRIYCDEDSLFLDTEPGQAEKIVQTLNRYLFREDVSIEDVTKKYGLLTIQGPDSITLLKNRVHTDIQDMADCSHLNLYMDMVDCKVVKTSRTGEEGYDIYASWDDLAPVWAGLRGAPHISLKNRGSGPTPFDPIPFGNDALETLRIEAGIPLYSVDLDEHTIPVEANLDKAISYDKGCYIGQETIARIKFRGHVNRALTGFCTDSGIIPARGDRISKIIHDIKHDIGAITSSCFSPTLNRPVAMGYIRVEYNNRGETVYIERGDKILTATVTVLPFYQSKSQKKQAE